MRYEIAPWSNLPEDERHRIFAQLPHPVSSSAERRSILAAMGGTLYLPASRPDLSRDLFRLIARGLTGAILDLEDSVRDESLAVAQANIRGLIGTLSGHWDGRPAPIALFVRVRSIDEMLMCLDHAGIGILAGFVVPKCDGRQLRAFASSLAAHGSGDGPRLMPVIETLDFARATTRHAALTDLAAAILEHREQILAVRFGAVDLAGAFGSRLDAGMSVYDIPFLAATLGDLVSVVSGAPVSIPVVGSVHEFYRESPQPFESSAPSAHGVTQLPGLTREVLLDRATGLWSKSVVHPVQALIVNALAPVSWSDYQDATNIWAAQQGGVEASHAGRRMNEARPHGGWAESTLVRAHACGVLRDHVRAAELLDFAFELARPTMAGLRAK